MISQRQAGWIAAVMTLACVGLIIRHGHAVRPATTSFNAHLSTSAEAAVRGRDLTPGDAESPVSMRDPRRDPRQVLQQGSLRDTVADGNVTVGFGGRLKPDLELRRLFDYYLTLIGETDLTGVRTLLQQDLLHRRLASPVQDEVMQVFDRYVRYQQAASEVASRPGLTFKSQFGELQALRQKILGENVAEAFYGAEQVQQKLLLQRLAVGSDQNLSPAEKTRQLQVLDLAAPAAEREARIQASIGRLVQQQTALLDEAHADAATRRAERAEIWGDAVADRLAQLDQHRAQWQARLEAYSARRKRIQQNDSLDTQTRQKALQQLLQTSFHGTEQLQVQAMAGSGVLGPVARR